MVNQLKRASQGGQATASHPPQIPNKDLFHRLNFTYQTSAFFSTLSPDESRPILHTKIDRKGKRKAIDAETNTLDLSRLSRNGMSSGKGMSVHNQLKL
jgi:hypothetical protein